MLGKTVPKLESKSANILDKANLESVKMMVSMNYPLVNCPITMENHHVQWENSLFRLGHFQ